MTEADTGGGGGRAVLAADVRDRTEAEQRALDLRLWTRLLPGIAVVAWCLGLVVLAINPVPAAILGAAFGVLTWRELRWRGRRRAVVADLEDALVAIEAGGEDEGVLLTPELYNTLARASLTGSEADSA